MSTITTAAPSSPYSTSAFWERLWRTAGIQYVGFFLITALILGYQPGVGASAAELTAFYQGDKVRILIATFFSGLNLLNLLWFAAALRTTLADAGRDGWGTAATAASAAFGALTLLSVAITAGLAYSIAGAGNEALTLALNDFAWALVVLTSFPTAMLIMSSAFGLWRAGLISNALFAAGVTAVVLEVLAGTTWLSGDIWSPDGAFSRFVSPALFLAWTLVVSRVLVIQRPSARGVW